MRKSTIFIGKTALLILGSLLVIGLAACQMQQTFSAWMVTTVPTATETLTPTVTFTATLVPTATATNTPTETVTATLLPTETSTLTPVPTKSPTKAAVSTSSSSSSTGTCNGTDSKIEAQIRSLINQQRANAGLSTLANNSQLANAARGHSRDMALNNYISHYGNGDPLSRVKAAGYAATMVGEIIYAAPSVYNTPYSAISGWMNSATHKAIILTSGFTELGVGYWCTAGGTYQGYYTVDFGKR